jgi:sarcosine oxidase, subunit beta
VLRGLMKMLPGLRNYRGKSPKPHINGGYYTKSSDNRPLIGKLPANGTYIIGALSGFGLMTSCAAGELLAAHVVNSQLPSYATAFSPERFFDPAYLQSREYWESSGQL